MELVNVMVEKKDHVVVITLNHPPAHAWNLATMEDFGKALDFVDADKQIRAIIITGAGEKFFSAGFDVSDAANVDPISTLARTLFLRLDRFTIPTIAAINGYAFGGGLELAMSCHFRVMADSPEVAVGLTELNLGIIPGWGGTQRLPRLVGRSKALEMILFSRRIDAKEALEIGLVDRICPREQVMDQVLQMAQTLAGRPPVAVRCVLEAMAAGLYEGLDAGLRVEEAGSVTVRDSKDRIEGFKAFLEKRAPVFTGE
jgi:enoyl-CoA hydratase/carnithine racemase